MRKTLLIADDHTMMLEGLSALLKSEFDVIGCATDGRLLLEETRRLQPDVVVLDVGMPEMNGIEAAHKISKIHPAVKMVFVTQQLAVEYVRAAFAAGAYAYVAKQSASRELVDAIRFALSGHYYVSPLVDAEIASLVRLNPHQNPTTLFRSKLTARQAQVLQLVAEGRSTKQISSALGITPKTVEFHRRCLMDELGIRSIAELTRYAVSHGIVSSQK